MRALLVASDDGRAARLEQGLREIGNTAILRIPLGGEFSDTLVAADPDVVVVDLARPERAPLDDLQRVGAHNPRPVVMFVGFDDEAFLKEAIAAGVNSYGVVNGAFPDLKPVVTAAIASFHRYQQVIADLLEAQTMLAERETINCAKKLLMKERNLDEPRAYRWLRRRAMQESRSIAAIAAALIAVKGDQNRDAGSE